MIKVMRSNKALHQLQEELTLLEKLGQQILGVVPDPPRPPSVTLAGHFSTYTTGSDGGWWITVRIPDDDAVNTFNAGVEACAEYVQKQARLLCGFENHTEEAECLDKCAEALLSLKRSEQ